MVSQNKRSVPFDNPSLRWKQLMEVLSLARLTGRIKLSRCSWTSSVNKRIAWSGQYPPDDRAPFPKAYPT